MKGKYGYYLSYKRKMKVVLPVCNPYITTYPIFANPLSILQNYPITKPWLLSSFLLPVNNKYKALSFYDFNYKECPFLLVEKWKKDNFVSDKDIIYFLKETVNRKAYPYFVVNTKEIDAYKREFYLKHDFFIYGYDDIKEIFYFSDNFKNGKYARGECTFKEVINSLKSLKKEDESYLGFNGCIELLSFIEKTELYEQSRTEISLNKIKDTLEAYCNGKNISQWSTQEYRFHYGEVNIFYGIECYDFLRENIQESENNPIHLPSFYLIYDHKMHLFRVWQHLLNSGFLRKDDAAMFNDLNKLISISNMIINLVLKVYFSNDKKKVIVKILKYIDQLESLEKRVLPNLVDEIV